MIAPLPDSHRGPAALLARPPHSLSPVPPGARGPSPRIIGRLLVGGSLFVMLLLIGFGGWVAFSVHDIAARAVQAATRADNYQNARDGMRGEQSLVRKYQLQPAPSVRDQYRKATDRFPAAMDDLHRDGDASDRALADSMLVLHTRYQDRTTAIFAAVDAGDPARASAIDLGEAEPLFDAMKAPIEERNSTHRVVQGAQFARLTRTAEKIFIAVPAVLVLCLGLLILFSMMLHSLQRRVARQKIARKVLTESEGRFRATFDQAAVGISQVTPDGRWLHVNPQFCDMIGYTGAELIGHTFAEITHPDDLAADLAQTRRLLAGEVATFTMEKRYIRKDGASVWANMAVSLVRTPGGEPDHFISVVEEITERKRTEEQLVHDALHDTLTGLPNRALLLDRLRQSLTRAGRRADHRFAVLYLDLDRFKSVNDSLGHALGDDLLREVARRLQVAIGEGTTIARLGGDEFVVLIEDIGDMGDAVCLAERLHDALHGPIVLEQREIFVAASIGIAVSTTIYHQPEELLRDADTAMYQAKVAGKARYVVFAPEMHTEAVARLEMETDLRGAVERGEMRVVYQPIVALASGKIAGVEALLRWDHPRLGAIPPSAFIPVAEETGLIVALGCWVLRAACRQVRAWQQEYPDFAHLTLGVNLSGRQLTEDDLPAVVQATLRETGLAPQHLNMEITESTLIAHADAAKTILGELRTAGVGIHLDDFGVGYSSLNYLRRFPIDTLKMDRSFVLGDDALARNEGMLRGIVGLAHGMRMRVVAEGIETAEQLAYLQTLGCDAGQGYHFSPPVGAQRAALLLAEPVHARERGAIAVMTVAAVREG